MDITDLYALSPNNKPAINSTSPDLPKWTNPPAGTDLTPMEPIQLFDNCFFVGTRSVGAFVLETSEGLIMIDTGWNEKDCSQFVTDMRKLGLEPANIKLILISHEHLDHYGGAQYLKTNVCPDAKVAMSLVGWNYLMTRPAEFAYDNPRPKSIDYFLADRDKVILGQTTIQVIATPGHSPGCLSFIIPITDKGRPHTIGMMGGTAVPNNWNEAYLYYSSIDYFMRFTRLFHCDIGLGTHAVHLGFEKDMKIILEKKAGDSNPLIIGTERFESEYLQKFRDLFFARVNQLLKGSPPDPMRLI